MTHRAAVVLAAAALCSATALPAVADDLDPGAPSASADASLLAKRDSSDAPSAPSSPDGVEDPLADPPAESGTDTGRDQGAGTGPDALADTGSDMGTGSDTGSDTGTGTGSDADTGTGHEAGAEQLRLTPSVVAAGAEVEVKVEGCRGTKVMARSEVFVEDAELSAEEGGGGHHAAAKVKSTTAPGRYKVRCDCGGEAELTVVGEGETPSAPVRAGGGGTAGLASKDEDGPGAVQILVGAGLASAAGLAVAGIALHRRRVHSAGD
ncbi:hypothetical protein ACFYYR_03150 [Streptomyces sp. NPDC001922]|uniref:hypothetical protein n=1 Tax=Streptomyces sp. NPDC001922 TaxID=3364624 RepID=UPI00369B740F